MSDINDLYMAKAVMDYMVLDMETTWAENCISFSESDICNCQNELFCGLALCKSNELVYLRNLKKYKHRKIKEILKKMMSNSEQELECKHFWHAYHIKTYFESIKKAFGEFLIN
jgi:inhibitor of KinA sporulation pathway (predicted exonuclease)